MKKIGKRSLLPYYLLGCLLLCSVSEVAAQLTRIRGRVYDAESRAPIPDVSIALLGLPVGTISSDEGVFFLETRKSADTLVAASVGYEPQKVRIQRGTYQEVTLALKPLEIALEEVVVRRERNPALPILDSVIRHKQRNNPKSIPLYSTHVYNKIEVDVNNIDSSFFDTPGLRDMRFLARNIDTNAATGKTFLPVFLSESLSRYHYRSDPETSREVIYASRMSGVERDDLTEFSGELYQDFNLYDNYMSVFNQGLVSPIHDNGTFYYHYFLVDSAVYDGYKQYRISFRPRRKQEPTFKGYIWVDTRGYAVTEAQYELDRSVNLNFVNYVMVQERFRRHEEQVWFPERKYFFLDLNLTDKSFGFFGHKTTLYDSLCLGVPIPRELLRSPNEVVVKSVVNEYSARAWDTLRREELSHKEQVIYRNVDTVKTLPFYKNARALTELLVNAHWKLGYVELGPVQQFYSFNPVEGSRVALGGRTTNLFHPKLRLSGLVAYGFEDQRWKWRGGVEYVLERYPWRKLSLVARHDMLQLGQAERTLKQDNILASVGRRYKNYSLAPEHHYQLRYFHEFYTGLSLQGDVGHRVHFPNSHVTFLRSDGETINSICYTYVGVEFRWKHKEKYFTNYFERQSIGSDYPEITLSTQGALRGVLWTDYSFLKVRGRIRQKLYVHPVGYAWLLVTGGVIFGRVPYPLLEFHEGSNTYAISRFGFDRLGFYELVSDRWISASYEHHFMGFFLNHVPLIRHLKLRELAGIKGVWGDVASTNLGLLQSSHPLRSVGSEPYVEAMLGLENILHILRVDVVWRLTHTTVAKRPIPSVRVGLALQF